MAGILEGIRILDLGRFISCPYCCMLLADMGAEVIKVERAGKGDDGRTLGPKKNDVSLYLPSFNRNKKGVTVNFRSEEGKKVFSDLIRNADVIVENFRAGTMAKMGFSYEAVKAINPKIIMASISGFGQVGPYADRAAFDTIVAAMGGLMSVNGTPLSGPMCMPNMPLVDHLTGIFTALGITLALIERAKTGEGKYLDMAMMDCLVPMLQTCIPDYSANGNVAGLRGSSDPVACPANCYKTQDGYVYMHAGTDPLFKRFLELANDPELMQYQEYDKRIKAYDYVDAKAAAFVATMSCEEAERIFVGAGIPCGVVSDIERIYNSDNAKTRHQFAHIYVKGVGEVAFGANPIKFVGSAPIVYKEAPELGEHNMEVYRNLLGYSAQRLEELMNKGAI